MASTHPRLGDAARILGELIAFRTEQPRGNLDLCARAAELLRGAGFDCRASRTPDGEKETLFAMLGAGGEGGVVLSAHSDVVDASNQDGWNTPPFAMREKGGTFYGRGACDMKGFIACVLATAPDFAKAKLNEPLYFALSRDEEIGCIGMPDVLALMREANAKPRMAFVGEPTMMNVVAGHKSGAEMRTVFTGAEAHSSRPADGVSAVEYAARFANYLIKCGEQMAQQAQSDSPFAPPHDTINIGVMRGGTAKNIIAGKCEVLWQARALPQNDLAAFIDETDDHINQTLLPMMRASGHHAEVENIRTTLYPGLIPDEESPAVQLAMQLTNTKTWQAVPFGADAGQFQQAGIATAIIGPGDITHAHKPNEQITANDLCACLNFLDNLRAKMSV